ncbi:MAG: Omp28-related outer membrane protein [Saprospiraceae bacterium]|nr:Omp28-related outer membrane protein [Saprospiraceae bacterium]
MKINYLLLLIPVLYFSCTKDEGVKEDIAVGVGDLVLESSSYKLPLNEYGVATLKTYSYLFHEFYPLSGQCEYYVNGQRLDSAIFRPLTTGVYTLQSVYKNLKSNTIQIEVEEPLNKKVLIELFTSRICGFCPWIALRMDSLHNANPKVISYSIHGQDELEINETHEFQHYLQVFERPSVRIERGYVRDYAAPIEMGRLIDSVHQFLSVQPKLEIAIQTSMQGNKVSGKVSCKYYEKIFEDLYLTIVLVEDGVITQNQYNYFSGYPKPSHGGPYISLPFYLPDYENHNVLRKFLTDPRGNKINKVDFFNTAPQDVAPFEIEIGQDIDPSNSWIIAIVHKRRDSIEASSVLNSQIVKVGETVDFSD